MPPLEPRGDDDDEGDNEGDNDDGNEVLFHKLVVMPLGSSH
jgi:hypothetical protein